MRGRAEAVTTALLGRLTDDNEDIREAAARMPTHCTAAQVAEAIFAPVTRETPVRAATNLYQSCTHIVRVAPHQNIYGTAIDLGRVGLQLALPPSRGDGLCGLLRVRDLA